MIRVRTPTPTNIIQCPTNWAKLSSWDILEKWYNLCFGFSKNKSMCPIYVKENVNMHDKVFVQILWIMRWPLLNYVWSKISVLLHTTKVPPTELPYLQQHMLDSDRRSLVSVDYFNCLRWRWTWVSHRSDVKL
jgi:hypothetical protein